MVYTSDGWYKYDNLMLFPLYLLFMLKSSTNDYHFIISEFKRYEIEFINSKEKGSILTT